VPWLDLLPEDELELGGVFCFNGGDDGSVECSEHLLGEAGPWLLDI